MKELLMNPYVFANFTLPVMVVVIAIIVSIVIAVIRHYLKKQ